MTTTNGMTTTIVARVVRVVMGHSPAALIHAREESGNEHKLEVAVEAARNMSAGQVLVLQWSVHNLPELATPHVVGEIVDATYTARPPEPSISVDEASPPAAATPGRSEAMQLERALGIRPGVLSSQR